MSESITPSYLKWLSRGLHALGAFSFLCVTMIAYRYAILPIQNEIASNNRLSARIDRELKNSKQREQDNQTLHEEWKIKQQEWDHLMSKLPATARESEFLGQVTSLGMKHDLKVSQFTPGVSAKKENYSLKQIQLQISGNYSNLCHFLHHLKDIERITHIQRMAIQNQKNNTEIYTVTLGLGIAYQYHQDAQDRHAMSASSQALIDTNRKAIR